MKQHAGALPHADLRLDVLSVWTCSAELSAFQDAQERSTKSGPGFWVLPADILQPLACLYSSATTTPAQSSSIGTAAGQTRGPLVSGDACSCELQRDGGCGMRDAGCGGERKHIDASNGRKLVNAP